MWTPGLRQRLGLDQEITDDEVTATKVSGDLVAVVEREALDWLARRGAMVNVLELVESLPPPCWALSVFVLVWELHLW